MVERPFECAGCKKPATVLYTEIVGDKVTKTLMCSDCPFLEKRLHGTVRKEPYGKESTQEAGLSCGHCGTSLEQIRMGSALGCVECYTIFSNVLIDDLIKAGRISRHLTTNKKTQSLHIGRTPGEVTEMSPTLRLIALNEALDETLVREDYEQAALLRDQIKALKEKTKQNEPKK